MISRHMISRRLTSRRKIKRHKNKRCMISRRMTSRLMTLRRTANCNCQLQPILPHWHGRFPTALDKEIQIDDNQHHSTN